MLHGGFGTGEQAERSYHWDAEAEAGHFLVAYPDGINRAWNAGTCCGEPQRIDTDRVASRQDAREGGFVASCDCARLEFGPGGGLGLAGGHFVKLCGQGLDLTLGGRGVDQSVGSGESGYAVDCGVGVIDGAVEWGGRGVVFLGHLGAVTDLGYGFCCG